MKRVAEALRNHVALSETSLPSRKDSSENVPAALACQILENGGVNE